MNITQEGEDQYRMSIRYLREPWLSKCCMCNNLLLNWAGSTYCCGSLCEIVAEGRDEVKAMGFDPDVIDQ